MTAGLTDWLWSVEEMVAMGIYERRADRRHEDHEQVQIEQET